VSLSAFRFGSRRRHALWRLFFLQAALVAVAPTAVATGSAQQDSVPLRILERRLRVTRDAQGDYRVVESIFVRIETASETPELPEPLALVELQPGADNVRGLGGDVAPGQVAFLAPLVVLSGLLPQRDVQLAFTYRLSRSALSLVLTTPREVRALLVEVDKGSLEVRPDPALTRDADGGAPSRPHRTYVADELAPGTTLTLEFVSSRVDPRQRFAVLVLTSLLALAAAVWVWRRA
jgi:hypothetical protein